MALHEKLDALRDHDLAELLRQQIELLQRLAPQDKSGQP